MKVQVSRFVNYSGCTVGLMFIDDVFVCFVLEDVFRATKVMHKTRIPAGLYKVSLQKSGNLHTKYAQKFSFHVGMLLLNNVPNFSGIMIHVGNSDKDSSGCLLVGNSHTANKQSIQESTLAYTKIYKTISSAILKGEQVELFISDLFFL
jgi:hypothetical protein